MSKHTPGPWTVGTDDDTPNIIVEDENGYIISEVRNDGDDKPEQRANAHLIAAAPAMYEALQDAYEKLCYLAPDKFDDEEHAANWQRDLSTMLAALAQAEGRQA